MRRRSTGNPQGLHFRDRNYAPADAEQRSEFDMRHEFYHVIDLVRRSEEDESSIQYSKAAWNDAVHSRILEGALRGLSAVCRHNVTTARIYPPALIPRRNLGDALESSMVDYAIVLNSPAALKHTLQRALDCESSSSVEARVQSINHTAYPPLRLAPIYVSIEAKAPQDDPSQAKAHLAVWGAAHLRRLDSLRRACTEWGKAPPALPTLPMIIAVGTSWDLYFMNMSDEGEIAMIGNQAFGDTKTLLGVYKLLCGLRAIAGWATELGTWSRATTELAVG